MNILIKLTSIVALIIAPHIAVNKPHGTADKTTVDKAKTEVVTSATGAADKN
jgi:hypothetical protein